MLKKVILFLFAIFFVSLLSYFSFIYYVSFSEGVRSGELIKISSKGMVFKTYEGEISQGISGAKIFTFSVLDEDAALIEQLKELQGQYVKVTYIERYRTFPWWGDTRYFVSEVHAEKSPHSNR